MLQTIIVLAIFLILLVLGGWMTFFGHRAFRFCGTLFGFALGVGSILFGAWQLGYAFDSVPVLIATPLVGLILGLLGAFVPVVTVGLGGLCFGFFYGVGLVSSADVLLGGAIAPVLYTGISILLIVAAFIITLVFRDAAKWLTTALCGSYVAAFSITLALTWFLAGGFQATDPALSGSFVLQIVALYGMMSATTKIFMLLFAIFFGVLGCVLQANAAEGQLEDEPAMLDFSSNPDEDPFAFDGEEFPWEEEDSPRKKKRKKRKRDRDLDLEEDSDVLDIFAAKKTRRGGNRETMPSSPSRVDTVTASDDSEQSEDSTQVFARVKRERPKTDEASTGGAQRPSAKRQAPSPKQQLQTPPAPEQMPAYEGERDDDARQQARRPSPPSRFAPRSERRKR